jgi:tRNA-2-methylthio-N6-dimethylallyladenosine synthase
MTKRDEEETAGTGPTYYIHTFGCQMNENDSERIAGQLENMGVSPAPSPEESDIIVINTCAVRKKSEEKLHSLLGRLAAAKKDRSVKLGVAGCMAQLYKEELMEKNPHIDFVIGPDSYWQIPKLLSERRDHFSATAFHRVWHEIPDRDIVRSGQVSAYVTIMEGCDNFCSYCVVPFTRGREKYRPMANILKEAESLAAKGYKEIQLLGQNVNSYVDPDSGTDFSGLLESVDLVERLSWIRFITSHPRNFTPEITRTMAVAQRVCRQLHLPVQSGSTAVLERMRRGYGREDYLDIIQGLRSLMPDISLSTDIIVGYPGESEEEFRETMSLLETVGYTNIFSFRYSPRPRAASSKEEDSVPLTVKRRRLIELQALQKEIQLKKNRTMLGRRIRTLCLGRSRKDNAVFAGRNEGYQVVNFTAEGDPIGRFCEVEITSCGPYSLRGEAKDL